MRKLSKDALDRLVDIRQHILEEPARFRMDLWTDEDAGPACNTTGCIAGWLILRDWMKREDHAASKVVDVAETIHSELVGSYEEEARKLLDLTYGEGKALFFISGWPASYRDRYDFSGDYLIYMRDENGGGGLWGEGVKNVVPAVLHSGLDVNDVLKARATNAKLVVELIDSVIRTGGIWWSSTSKFD